MSTDQFDLILYDMYCADAYLPPLFGKWVKEYKKASYSHWAIEELRDYVARKFYPRTCGPVSEFCELVEEFADRMFQYANLNQETSLIFQTASDTAADVLDLLEALK